MALVACAGSGQGTGGIPFQNDLDVAPLEPVTDEYGNDTAINDEALPRG